MKRLGLILVALLASSPAWAAKSWHPITVTGSGGQTGAYTTCFIHTSTVWSCINRRATSMASVVTVYEVTAGGEVTATDYTPPDPTVMELVAGIGGDEDTIIVTGAGKWGVYADLGDDLSDPGSWAFAFNNSNSGDVHSGITWKSPLGDGKFRFRQSHVPDNAIYLQDYILSPFSGTTIASSAPDAEDQEEFVSVPVSDSLEVIASTDISYGRSYFRAYVSGGSFAFTTTESAASAPNNSFYYQPFAMNSTIGAFTIRRSNNNQIYIRFVTNAAITELNTGSTTDLRPGCATDDFTGADLGWWVGASDGKLYKSNSISAPTSISNDATYDMTSEALQSSTPVVMFCNQWNGATVGVDIDQDGTAGDPIVLLANKKLAVYATDCTDADGDGYGATSNPWCTYTGSTDCDDTSASVYPGATEIPGDGIDQDCSGADTPAPVARIATPSAYGGSYGGAYGAILP